jgi:hypothetical protein
MICKKCGKELMCDGELVTPCAYCLRVANKDGYAEGYIEGYSESHEITNLDDYEVGFRHGWQDGFKEGKCD